MEQVKNEPFQRKILSFYRYTYIEDPKTLRDDLYRTWEQLRVLGRIYVAYEGINAQMSVPEMNWDAFLETLKLFPVLENIPLNIALEPRKSAFFKLDIRTRKKIVVDGLDEDLFRTSSPGEHLPPEKFHELVGQKDVVVVDARNHYECDIGHFENALLPTSKTFSKVLPELGKKLTPVRDKKILMYCTGGIRCEKASAYLKRKGFKNVFQLQGGIVNYLNEMKRKNITPKYKGSLYVFDERMAEVTAAEKLGKCYQCGSPHSAHSNCGYIHCHGLMIQCPSCAEKLQCCCSEKCVEYRSLLKLA